MFKRLPTFRWKPPPRQELVPREEQANHPELEKDFEKLRDHLMEEFWKLDEEALKHQNQFRLDQMQIIFGGVLAALLGVLQAALSNVTWIPGVLEAILASYLGYVAFRSRGLKSQEKWIASRLKAERLRGEYFLFLGRIGEYADNKERVPALIRRVADIREGIEPFKGEGQNEQKR
ncbi:MAG: DUF4231 domain-containing protein [Anaerolineae bacterium]